MALETHTIREPPGEGIVPRWIFLGDARIYRYCLEDETLEDITPSSLDKDGEFVDNGVEQGKTYTYFLADGSVLKEGDSPPQPYQVVTSYYPDVENGVALEAMVSL